MIEIDGPCSDHCGADCPARTEPGTSTCLRRRATWCMIAAKKVDGGYRLAFERLGESLMEDAQAVDEERRLIAWSPAKLP